MCDSNRRIEHQPLQKGASDFINNCCVFCVCMAQANGDLRPSVVEQRNADLVNKLATSMARENQLRRKLTHTEDLLVDSRMEFYALQQKWKVCTLSHD